MPVKFIFVERNGSAPAAAAVSLVVERLAKELSPQVACAATSAREEAAAACQAELEAKAAETEILVKQLKELEEKEARRAADSARAAELKAIRDLKAKLQRDRERQREVSHARHLQHGQLGRGEDHRGQERGGHRDLRA